jgi:mono/diheme cytochrome c family protein
MVSFADHLKEDDVAAIRAYILSLANAEYEAQQKAAATPPPAPPQ